jgi:MFS family permease
MNSRSQSDYRIGSLIWAAGLFLVGLVLLLFNFGVFDPYEPLVQYILAGLLALSAVGFFVAYFSTRRDWAQLIPAWTLLALAAMALLSVNPAIDQRLNAAVLFIGLALAFAHIYLLDRAEHWWAIIPGGFMLVLGVGIGLSSVVANVEALGAALFIGMGLVFLLLYFLVGRRQWWALVPGSVLLLLGFFVFSVGSENERTLLRWWPVILMVIGVIVGVTAYRRKPRKRLTVNSAPAQRSSASPSQKDKPAGPQPRTQIGDYSRPAPGATVEILPDPESEASGKG